MKANPNSTQPNPAHYSFPSRQEKYQATVYVETDTLWTLGFDSGVLTDFLQAFIRPIAEHIWWYYINSNNIQESALGIWNSLVALLASSVVLFLWLCNFRLANWLNWFMNIAVVRKTKYLNCRKVCSLGSVKEKGLSHWIEVEQMGCTGWPMCLFINE